MYFFSFTATPQICETGSGIVPTKYIAKFLYPVQYKEIEEYVGIMTAVREPYSESMVCCVNRVGCQDGEGRRRA